MTFLVILMLIVSQVVGLVQRTWVRANSQVSQFREARVAFDTLARNLTQATLNTYWENEFDPLGTDSACETRRRAKNYVRQSELQFITGPSTTVMAGAVTTASNYPGHAVFFQAPLGVTRLVATTAGSTQQANTENMVSLLCGRGYFVEWGDDAPFRPAFLSEIDSVPVRSRLRLMEYSPTAEMNRIYDESLRPLVNNETGVNNGKKWYTTGTTSVLSNTVKEGETVATRAFTRPIAENILCLIISPQLEKTGSTVSPYSIAPQYIYDSTLTANPGASSTAANPQGTQHVLPPILKITMVALDERSGEVFAREENDSMRSAVFDGVNGMFKNAASFQADLDGVGDQQGALEELLLSKGLNYRFFTTTIALKQSRWSF